jgi:transposase-like protein
LLEGSPRAQAVPAEFRGDVIAVAPQGDQSIAHVARSLAISQSYLARWLKIADREDGISAKPAAAAAKGADPDLEAENRELRQRTKQLEN